MSGAEKECTFKAVALSLTATILWSIGNCVQKKAFNNRQECDDFDQPRFYKSKVWICGFITYAIGSIVHAVALSFGSLSTIAPLEALTLVWNTILAAIFLSEAIRPKHIRGIILIVLGSVLIVKSGPQAYKIDSGDEKLSEHYKDAYLNTQFCVFGLIVSVIALTLWIIMEYYTNLNINVINMKANQRVYTGQKMVLLSMVYLACYASCWNMILQKTLTTFFKAAGSDIEGDFPWYSKPYYVVILFKETFQHFGVEWFFYFNLIGMVFANFGLEYFRAKALEYYNVAIVIPIFRVGCVLGGIAVGALYFCEFSNFNAKEKVAGFILAILLNVFGIMFLTSSRDDSGPWGDKCTTISRVAGEVRESVRFSTGLSAIYIENCSGVSCEDAV